jgi:peptidoglycan LD-endopeptidase CwlK
MPSKNQNDLHPALNEFWDALKTTVKAELGFEIFLTCTHRSDLEQNRLYAQGRSISGNIVTNARGGQSPHNVSPPEGSHALDYAVLIGGNVSWEFSRYVAVGHIAKRYGADVGALWDDFPDGPHIQMPDWKIGKRYGADFRFRRRVVVREPMQPKPSEVRVMNALNNTQITTGTLVGDKLYLDSEALSAIKNL